MSPNFVQSGSSSPSRKRRSETEIVEGGNEKIFKEEGDFSDEDNQLTPSSSMDEGRRAHHNELERRRRDHIKDHFMTLKNSVPLLEGEKSSRAIILKRAVDYILILQSKIKEQQMEIEDLKRHNESLHKSMKICAANEVLSSLVSSNAQAINYRPIMQSTQILKEDKNSMNLNANNNHIYNLQSHSTPDSLKGINLNLHIPTSREISFNNISPIPSSNPLQPINNNFNHLFNINNGVPQQLNLINIPNNIGKFSQAPSNTPMFTSSDMDLQTRILANTLALREQKYAATITM
ncbi:Protein max [Strongyloides ratti]|uniref:Protein max n=1 Tax=Strongyloides ratti TaxID=34506 RepID=A0A090LKR5_STRRB|nr:Protein max [Strongyloides ratti]CEF70298.1 Protein max [Strongyloides ratti]